MSIISSPKVNAHIEDDPCFSCSYKYVGWVPCLNGQLVFSLVECGLKDERQRIIERVHYCKDGSGKLVEYVLVHSTVNWQDFGGEDLNGLWSVVLFSKRPLGSKYHEGAVYFMPKEKTLDEGWTNVLDIAHDINKELLSSLKTGTAVDVVQQLVTFGKKIEHFSLSNERCYKAVFKLEEDGMAWLNYQYKRKEEIECDEEEKIITRQAYYYIKYLCT